MTVLFAARAAAHDGRDPCGSAPSTSTSCTVPTSAPLRAGPWRWTQLDQPLHALALDLLGHLVGHRGGLGAAARRVDEGERVVVADLVADLERLLEVLLRLAREADDDVGRERDAGHRGAHALDQARGSAPASRCGASP